MNLQHPARLALLLVVGALLVGYLALQRRRARAVAAYTNPDLLDSIAPNRMGSRRHLAPALGLLALIALVIAVAQPTTSVRVPRRDGVVVLAVDVSNSMVATDIAPTRLQAAITGASAFVRGLPDGMQVGLVAFDGDARTVIAPTTDHAAAVDAIHTLSEGPATAAGEGIYTSLADVAKATGTRHQPAAIVLISDGATTRGRSVTDAARAAAAAHVPITTIAYGTPNGTVTVQGQVIDVPADDQAMRQIAQITGATFFQATSAGQLRGAYADIQSKIGYTTRSQQATTTAMAAALALAVGAVGIGLLTTSRPL